jgi:hypothetical protein
MERTATVNTQELKSIAKEFPLLLPDKPPIVPYSSEDITKAGKDSILILGIPEWKDGKPLSLATMRDFFGIDPDISEPCFYNQDWYLKEDFIHHTLENKWYFIKKNIIEESRAVQPSELVKIYNFPTAILCAYTFFVWYFLNKEYLWEHDFVWCSDTDHNGDRIYVGKYHDIDGVNKNGFSIHRHLALRKCYGAIDAG